ncbi:serine/arginine repetitive matrix protein 1-like isoform X2 [Silurus meridionalis]|uniref:serine/arginine repetitive matrix protein 1-like isoform X2 n=1 Tax=Silurus meridionalis TaxID=175797 RepID=UPI001EEA9D7B|nr:serine/arginine repetitive matrix protein 1-like isoform X2 [Silurus meridionalis]
MPSTGDERVCSKFQPNIFNPSRCHECLRLKHLHTHTPTHTPEQVNLVTESSSSSREEKEQSTKEDSDDVSVVSGGSLCILSPECDLYVCDGDESQDEDEHTCNSQCEGDSSSPGSFTPEEEDGFFSLPLSRMTRLDPSSHRNNPRMWMEEARNRESFSRRSSVPHVSSKVEQDRESGYFSLGRVTGARTLSDKSPSPHRHAERGHPLPSNRTHEPKAAIPFRNPDLGVPSQRRTTEIQNPDLTLLPLNPSPEPVDLSIEVEAQAGPRSLSPTPFKQAESLGASQKKGFRSPSSPSSKNLFSTKQDSGFSRSLSPSCSATPFKRAESVSSLSSRGYGMDSVSERRAQPCKSPNRNSFVRPSESEAIRKTFRGFASTVGAVSNLNKSQTSPYADLRAGLRKTEPPSGQGAKTRSPSPARRSQDAAGRTFPRKTEPPSGQGSKTRSPSPARRSQDAAGRTFLRKTEPPSGQGSKTRSPSPARRSQDAAGQSFLRKTESKTVSNNQKKCESRTSSPSRSNSRSILRKVVEGWRSASPVRKGYGTASQLEKSLVSNGRSHNGSNSSSLRRSFETSSPSLHKSETKRLSPILRRSYDAPTKQSSLHKSGSDRSSYNRSPSPSKQNYGSPGQSNFRSDQSNYSRPVPASFSRSPSPSKRDYDPTGQSHFRSDQSNYSRPVPASLSRSPSPSKRDYDPTGQSHFRSDHSNYSRPVPASLSQSPSPSKRDYDPTGQSHFRSDQSNYSRPVPASLSRCPSPSKHGCDPPGQSHFRSDYNNYSGSIRSSNSQSFFPSKWDYDPSGQSHFQKSESSKRTEASRSSCNQSLSSSKRSYDPSDQSSFRSEHSNYSKNKHGQAILHKTVSESRSVSASYMEKSADSSTAGSWRGSTHSLLSPPMSRNSSPSRKCNDSKQLGDRKSSHVSWSTNERRQSQDNHSPASRNRSPSPLSRSHTSSQSSIDSVMSSGSSGMNREEYAIMADLPKVKKVLQRARPNQMEGMERGTREETSLYKPASHSHTKPAHITWDDMMDQRGNPSSTHTPSHTEGNKMEQEKSEKVHQPDLLNFKKGWMSKQDESGEWKKHWFVLTDAGLKYYRDSGAEEKDELDGEIDLRSCLKVSEFDVEKNYGFQIQTVSGVFTLSAMTAGIRRNWIEVLRKNIQPNSTPDLTQLPDSTANKEDPRQQPSRRQSETSSISHVSTPHKFDYVELSPVDTPTPSAPANRREAGEGQVREHGQGQEEKNRNAQRETGTTRRWPGKTQEQRHLEEEIERKWEEFERLPLKAMTPLSALGALQSRWHH